jgi:hypothetical protein
MKRPREPWSVNGDVGVVVFSAIVIELLIWFCRRVKQVYGSDPAGQRVASESIGLKLAELSW